MYAMAVHGLYMGCTWLRLAGQAHNARWLYTYAAPCCDYPWAM